MLQKPNVVLVGTQLNTTGTSLAVGDIVVINAETGAVIPVSDLTSSVTSKAQLGLVKKLGATAAENLIEKSNVINRKYVTSLTPNGATAYQAPSEASASVDFTGSTFTPSYRYVIRIVYRDIYERPGQFTHTYEAFAGSSDTASTMVAKFVSVINNHKGARVSASTYAGVKASKAIGGITFEAVSAGDAGNDITVEFAAATTSSSISVTGNAITITPKTGELALANIQALIAGSSSASALVVAKSGTATGSAVSATALTGGIDATPGVLDLTAKSIVNEVGLLPNQDYKQVSISAVAVYYTIPMKFLGYEYNAVPGVDVTITDSKPGKGNPYIVKQREYAALGYKGVSNKIYWPAKVPTSNVDLTSGYNTFNIEFGVNYQSPDNQYIKRTDCAAEVYTKSASSLETLRDTFATWAEIND